MAKTLTDSEIAELAKRYNLYPEYVVEWRMDRARSWKRVICALRGHQTKIERSWGMHGICSRCGMI